MIKSHDIRRGVLRLTSSSKSDVEITPLNNLNIRETPTSSLRLLRVGRLIKAMNKILVMCGFSNSQDHLLPEYLELYWPSGVCIDGSAVVDQTQHKNF